MRANNSDYINIYVCTSVRLKQGIIWYCTYTDIDSVSREEKKIEFNT